MTSFKPIAGIGMVVAAAALILTITLQEDQAIPFSEPGASQSSDSPNRAVLTREEIDSLFDQLTSLRKEIGDLTQARTAMNETNGDLREQVASLQDQVSEIVSRVDIEKSNPLDSGIATSSDRQVPDEVEQGYVEEQRYFEAENEFLLQEEDSQWAISTENQLRERLFSSPDMVLPVKDADMASAINSLECRSGSCRIEISKADDVNLEEMQFQVLASTVGLFDKGTVHKTDTGGMVFYMHAEP
jgi:FtsZ-binding cell division protein ZapB